MTQLFDPTVSDQNYCRDCGHSLEYEGDVKVCFQCKGIRTELKRKTPIGTQKAPTFTRKNIKGAPAM